MRPRRRSLLVGYIGLIANAWFPILCTHFVVGVRRMPAVSLLIQAPIVLTPVIRWLDRDWLLKKAAGDVSMGKFGLSSPALPRTPLPQYYATAFLPAHSAPSWSEGRFASSH